MEVFAVYQPVEQIWHTIRQSEFPVTFHFMDMASAAKMNAVETLCKLREKHGEMRSKQGLNPRHYCGHSDESELYLPMI